MFKKCVNMLNKKIVKIFTIHATFYRVMASLLRLCECNSPVVMLSDFYDLNKLFFEVFD